MHHNFRSAQSRRVRVMQPLEALHQASSSTSTKGGKEVVDSNHGLPKCANVKSGGWEVGESVELVLQLGERMLVRPQNPMISRLAAPCAPSRVGPSGRWHGGTTNCQGAALVEHNCYWQLVLLG